ELVAGALVLVQPLRDPLVETTVRIVHGLLEQPVLRLEVVEDGGRARAGALGDVADPRVEQPALVQDLGSSRHNLRLAQVFDLWPGTHWLADSLQAGRTGFPERRFEKLSSVGSLCQGAPVNAGFCRAGV